MSLEDEIRSRGYWWVVIHPDRFESERVGMDDLEPIVTRAKVQLRGWDYPHLCDQPKWRQRSITCSTDWRYYRETWRLYRSGQFTYLMGVHEDWADRAQGWGPPPGLAEHGPLLGVGDALFKLTETLEFAARLAVTPLGGDAMQVKVEVGGLKNRMLWVDSPTRWPMENEYRADVSTFVVEDQFSAAQLAANARDLAADWALDLYRRFGWKTTREIVVGQQDELRRPHE